MPIPRGSNTAITRYGALTAWARDLGGNDFANFLAATPKKRKARMRSSTRWPNVASIRLRRDQATNEVDRDAEENSPQGGMTQSTCARRRFDAVESAASDPTCAVPNAQAHVECIAWKKGPGMYGIVRIAGLFVVGFSSLGTALGASSPYGVWIDQTGRGAVEITDCGGKLCGKLVWFKDSKNDKDGCNFQIIGNVRPVGGNKWDNGWIVDPDKDPNKKYDVEITPQGDQKLKVMGYAGMKFLSETMIWTRAPADLKKCGEEVASTPAPVPAPASPDGPLQREVERGEDPSATPAPTPEVGKPAKREAAPRKKDCKIGYGGFSITVPCDALD
jgi:uncharacterized protein (DUF2147 family)